MVWLSDRQRRIVMELSRADSAITGDSLSRMLGCSKRTIQSDISRINIASGRRIVNSTNRGYELDSSIDEVLVEGFAPAGEEPPFSGHALVRELLLSDSAPTASDLAVRFYSSQSSVARALKRVRSLLEPYDLRLEKTDGRLYVTGTPENRKRFLRDMVLEEAQDAYSSGYSSLSNELDVKFISDTLQGVLDERDVYIEPGYLKELSIDFAAALWLFRTYVPFVSGNNAGWQVDTVEWQIAVALCAAYGERWRLAIPDGAKSSLASHLRGFIRFDGADTVADSLIGSSFLDDVACVVGSAFETYGLPVVEQKKLLPLARHVCDLIGRYPHGQLHGDEIATEIRSSYPFVYEVSLLVAHGIAERFGVGVSMGELGPICIHIGFLVGVDDSNRLSVAVVAGPYRDTATTIRDRLMGHFGNKFSITIAKRIQDVPELSPDLLVTTELTSVLPERTVRVSPLFGTRDLVRVEKMSHDIQSRGERARRKMICRYIEDELFVHDSSHEILDKVTAIEMLSGRLMELGIVSEAFPASVMAREEAASACFNGLFALPHATVMDAHRTVVCTLISDAGVDWDGAVIHLVMMIAVCDTDRSQFSVIFNDLARHLMDKESLYRLTDSTTAEEFRQMLCTR